MSVTQDQTPPAGETSAWDAVVVGAGFAGLYAVHRLREMGLRVHGIEAGSGVGGTWFWNRYPGARCDIESVDYCFSFSDELQAGWTWSERYATQPEILRYLEHVADRLELRPAFTFDTRVDAARYDDDRGRWTVTTERGDVFDAQYVVMAVGVLSSLKTPDIPGFESFAGETFHTARWPEVDPDLSGKRVGFIGTGSSGVQAIPMLAERAGHLTVLQRTPNFSIPARNRPLRPEEIAAVKDDHPGRRERRRTSRSGFVELEPVGELLAFPPEERDRILEERWAMGGAAQLIRAFTDVGRDAEANDWIADFVRGKIRDAVDDPEVAEKLIPTGYHLGTKRICVDTDYFATYNRSDVTLVDVRKDPIVSIVPEGVRLESGLREFDHLVFATGFDALTGAILDIDVRGRDGASLRDAWSAGPRTLLGVAIPDYPNLFTITGPGSPSVLGNVVTSIEQHVEWIADLVEHVRSRGDTVVEATPEGEAWWSEQARSSARGLLLEKAESWYSGANIPGKPRALLPYAGGVGVFRDICDEVARDGYRGLAFSRPAAGPGEQPTEPVGVSRTLP